MACDTWWEVNSLSKFQLLSSYSLEVEVFCELDGVGPIDDRPSTDKSAYILLQPGQFAGIFPH